MSQLLSYLFRKKNPLLAKSIARLEQEAAAGAKLREAIGKLETSWCDGKHHENIGRVCPQDWRSLRDRALADYDKSLHGE